ncbi:FkbM family methyltransferase [Mycobacterium xenopi]|uniref:FkbM family methyltransferase n=1 Tax=Mycobacterium xenopi TaxID=1789 RepID=UPI0022EA7528|nr:FkbM family methyltransferase [Mycobacterium xenopi]MDA3656856.1 FkbM family methyltransferase [Mycobacterium xenopi]MDA3662402.1 FkbM family methyltransferase [Mycobacterium xenopi]
MTQIIRARTVALWRASIRLLRTDKERVSSAERWIRALLLIVPYYAMALLLNIRAAWWRPLTVDGISDDGIRLRCQLPEVLQMYVYLFGAWEPDLEAFMRRRLRPGDTFIDVGANIGYLSALASQLVGPHGAVVAIEPAPFAGAALQETAALNGLTNIRLVAAAVSDRDGQLPLFVGSAYDSGLTTTVARLGRHFRFREQERVRAAMLGSLVTREELASARLIKIDVEGAEDRVLAGLLVSLDILAPEAELVVEVMPRWWSDPQLRPIDVLQPFLERGFHVYQLPCNYWPWRYLWPRSVGAPQRLRDLAALDRRGRLDLVLSRFDADTL